MKKNLFIPLCAFLIMAANIGWTLPIRILVGATSAIIIANTVKNIIDHFWNKKEL